MGNVSLREAEYSTSVFSAPHCRKPSKVVRLAVCRMVKAGGQSNRRVGSGLPGAIGVVKADKGSCGELPVLNSQVLVKLDADLAVLRGQLAMALQPRGGGRGLGR